MNIKNTFKKMFFKTSPKSIFRKDDYLGLNLRNVINNSYNPQSDIDGFSIDKNLSGKRQQVYINPEDKRLLYTIAGTRSGTDILNDFALATGGLKNTERYKSAERTLELAKSKYPEYKTTIVGSSLGGSIAQRLGGNDDRRITYNSGEVFGKERQNTINIRNSGDIISLLGAPKSYNLGSGMALFSPKNWLYSHSTDALKDNYFI